MSGRSRVARIIKYVSIGVMCLVVVVLSSGLSYRKYLQHKVAETRAIRSPHGIDSLQAVRIGGIDQWIEVRGQNVDNPILLWIHGGPGIGFIPLAGSFQGPWEKHFTVVQWDQRGAGKTFASNDKELQRRTMNVPQMQQDTVDVVTYLCGRFHRQKVFVAGHSWGSVLGLWLAHEHPELIYAYVGTGQVINVRQAEEIAYQEVLQAARLQHNAQAVKELESIAPYPPVHADSEKMGVAKGWEQQLLGSTPSGAVFLDTRRLLTDLVSAPEYSLVEDYRWLEAQSFSDTLLPELMQIDLTQLGPDFQAPIFFFEGRHDEYCPPSLVWEYYQEIKAPQKEFVWFENSGHFPFFEEQRKFADELVQRVLPVGKELSGRTRDELELVGEALRSLTERLLPQFRVFGFGSPEDGNVRVRVLPERQKSLVCRSCPHLVSTQQVRPAKLQVCPALQRARRERFRDE